MSSPAAATPRFSGTRTLELELLTTAAGRKALSGFFVSGLLFSFLGAILPVWGFHRESEFGHISYYFLALSAGVLAAVRFGRVLLNRLSLQTVLILSCLVASGGFCVLAWFTPVNELAGRLGGLGAIGAAVGFLNTALLHAITPVYRQDPAATLNVSGLFFGSGCLASALLVASTVTVYLPGSVLGWLAIAPLFFAGYYARTRFPKTPVTANLRVEDRRGLGEVVADFQSPGAVMFGLLLFFQFGNEWTLAGWLPVLMIQRLGISPLAAVLLLAEYWLFLMIGRGIAQALLPRFSHPRLLMGSVVAALFGCLVLATTVTVFGAVMAVLFVGSGFAMIYPLVAEKIGNRFPYYHPGFFNGIFSIAFVGGLISPAMVGPLTDWLGIRAAMVLPFAGTLMVFFLLVLIWIETKLTRPSRS